MKAAILGFGTVGSGAWETLKNAPDAGVEIKKILVRRPREGYGTLLTTDIDEILNDPEIEIVAEAMGGLHPAYEYVTAALKAGKHVVSANKHLICEYFTELHTLAAECGRELRFTPAVGGGIPWLFNLRRTKRCDEILSFRGIVNGTTNFILDAMQEQGADYDEVLKEAQRLGFAEADPTADVDGYDARRKCAISASLAFDTVLGEADVPTFGMRHVTAADVKNFKALKLVCRLLASAEKKGDTVSACVEPTLLAPTEVEAAIHGSFNCITLEAVAAGTLRFIGAGAGKMPTGSSLAEDMIDVTQGWGRTAVLSGTAVKSSADAVHPYYLRTSAALPEGITAKKLDGGAVITVPMAVSEAHVLADSLTKSDPEAFFAGIREA